MNERDWKRLKALYKKHVAMAKKVGWRVYKGPHGPAWSSGRVCPFSHFQTGETEPPFAFLSDGWMLASSLWKRALDEDPARLRREFGWRAR